MVELLCWECAGGPECLERDRLEQIEDLSESLANDLLALSVALRDGDAAEIEDPVPRIFSRGEVLIDDRMRVLEVHSGWSAEARTAIHALAGLAPADPLPGAASD